MKRVLSTILVICLIISLVPVQSAFGIDEENAQLPDQAETDAVAPEEPEETDAGEPNENTEDAVEFEVSPVVEEFLNNLKPAMYEDWQPSAEFSGCEMVDELPAAHPMKLKAANGSSGVSLKAAKTGEYCYLQQRSGGYITYGNGYGRTNYYTVTYGSSNPTTVTCTCANPSKTGPGTGDYSSRVEIMSASDSSNYLVMKAVFATSPFGPNQLRQSFWSATGSSGTSDVNFAYLHAIIGHLYEGGKRNWANTTMDQVICGSGGLLENIINYANTHANELSGVNLYRINFGASSGGSVQDMMFATYPTYWAYVKKVSTDPDISSGNSNYSLANAKYGIYANSACTGTPVATVTTGDNGVSEPVSLIGANYWAKELSAPKGFKLNSTPIGPINVGASGTSTWYEFYTTDEPEYYWAYVRKVSSDAEISDGNSNYSLANAKYGIYNNSACTGTPIKTVTTGDNGYSEPVALGKGNYWAKEISAPKGFKLNSSPIGPINVGAAGTSTWYEFYATDEPEYYWAYVKKVSSNPTLTSGNPNYSLGNAQYGIYNNSTCTGTPIKTVATGDNGISEPVALGKGTYWAKELSAPKGFKLNDSPIGPINVGAAGTSTWYEFSATDEPELTEGYAWLTKSSSNTSITDGNPNYSLVGAQYNVYSDSDLQNLVGVLKIEDENGGNVIAPPGVPIKQSTESTNPHTRIYTETGRVGSIQNPGLVTLSPLSVKGFEYVIVTADAGYAFYGENGEPISWDSGNIGPNAKIEIPEGASTIVIGWSLSGNGPSLYLQKAGDLPSYVLKLQEGKYYVKEAVAPKGYKLDKEVHEITVTSEEITKVQLSDEPKTGSAMLAKHSTNPDITDNNSCYSLLKAEYSIYSDPELQNLVGVATTKWTSPLTFQGKELDCGIAYTVELPLGKYYIKETKAPAGYYLNEEVVEIVFSDTHTFDVLEFEDPPKSDPIGILLQKKDKDTGNATSAGNASLEGALFEIKYYDLLTDGVPSVVGREPVRTWVFKTNKNGFVDFSSPSCFVSGDELYYDLDIPTIPVGTITIQEIQAPEHYIKDDTIYFRKIQIDQPAPSGVSVYNAPEVPNEIYKAKLQITKYAEGHNGDLAPENGAKFQVYLTSAGGYANAKSYQRDFLTTDTNGVAVSKDLPVGRYTVHQVEGWKSQAFVEDFEVDLTKRDDGSPIQVGDVINTEIINEHLAPKIATTATVGDNQKTVEGTESVVVKDVVEYENLDVGKEYTLVGTLMDKSTGQPFKVDGHNVTSEVKFTPTVNSSKYEVPIDLNSGYSLDFEEKTINFNAGDEHSIQVIEIPAGFDYAIITASEGYAYADQKTATFADGDFQNERVALPDGTTMLVIGCKTGETPTVILGNSSAAVTVQFEFDGRAIRESTDLVVFETLLYDGDEIAHHNDINDAGQTVTVTAGGVDFEFTKVDAKDMAKTLGGAEFKLTSGTKNGETYNWNGEVKTASSESNGRILFEGLRNGVYKLEETKAPTGYLVPNGYWIVTVDRSNTQNPITITAVGTPNAFVKDGTASKLPNSQIMSVPFTGTSTGMALQAISFALAAGALTIAAFSQRKKRKANAD